MSSMKIVPSVLICNTNFEIYINILFLVFETIYILHTPFGREKLIQKILHYKEHKTNITYTQILPCFKEYGQQYNFFNTVK